MSIARHPLIMFGTKPAVGGAFDADYQSVLTYATGKGYTLPNAAQQIVGNAFVLALKADGTWAKSDRIFVPATNGDSDFATIDWKNPSDITRITKVNSPTFTTNSGFAGNGTTSYLNLNFNPVTQGVNFLYNDYAVLYAITNAGSLTAGTFGGVDDFPDSPRHLTLQQKITGGYRVYFNQTAAEDFILTHEVSRVQFDVSGTNGRLYRNGSQESTTRTITPLAFANYSYYALALNREDVPTLFNDDRLGVIILSGSNTANAVTVNTSINTYLTDILST